MFSNLVTFGSLFFIENKGTLPLIFPEFPSGHPAIETTYHYF